MNDSKAKSYAEKIERVCDYIYRHLDDDLSLEQLAQVAHFSKFHFHRQFSEYTGVSVFKFIQLMRLKRASYQLAFNRNDRIIDIALEASFENPESFSRAFKNIFEQTPSQFRKSPEWPLWHSKFLFSIPNIERKSNVEIKIVEFDETKVAALEHRGAPDRVLESAAKFIDWRKQSKLSPAKTSKTFGIAYDDPKTTDASEFRFDICGSINTDAPDNSQGVTTKVIPGGRCAVVRHRGSHDEIDESVHYLYG